MLSREERIARSREALNTGESNLLFNMSSIEKFTGIKEISVDKLIPAPKEWNFYSPLSDDKREELVESILTKGLLTPIVVWEQPDGTFMILAGHNRVEAYNFIRAEVNDEHFNMIPAFIKGVNEINEYEAREIIIDTNWVTRNLTPLDISRSIVEKYTVLRNKAGYGKYGDGRVRDIISKQFNMSGRQVDNYRKLVDLIPEFQHMVNNNDISFTHAINLTSYDDSMQKWIYETFQGFISNETIKNVKKDMSKAELKNIFIKNKKEINKISLSIPSAIATKYKTIPKSKKVEFEKEFMEFFRDWYEKNIS